MGLSSWAKVLFTLFALLLCAQGHAQQRALSIQGFPPKGQISIFGSAWYLYLEGTIDANASERLEQYILQNKVPQLSTVVINSEGGSLVEGMRLGRVIRKYGLNTDVGKRTAKSKEPWETEPGVCFSACTLAYVGGKFRYLKTGSRYGVHRFYSSSASGSDMDVAQLASAAIVAYLREMDVDSELFTLSTKAGRNEIHEPPRSALLALNVINEGFPPPKWSVESLQGRLYLKGERETSFGMNKFIVHCVNGQMELYIIIDPQGREDEIMFFEAHTLVIGSKHFKVKPYRKHIHNGWFNANYILTNEQVAAFRSASTVGLMVQLIYDAPVFLGFENMPFEAGKDKFLGIANTCR